MFNILISGVGGQGILLASKLIASAAMKKGYNVRTTETIGMAQRGGCVVSHVRIGDNIFSPLIPLGKADALIAFEPAEAVRQLIYLREQGALIVCDTAIKPAGASAGADSYNETKMIDYIKGQTENTAAVLKVIDGSRLAVHGTKTLNVALLGAAAQAGIFPFDAELLKQVITETLHERFVEMNIKSYETGRNI